MRDGNPRVSFAFALRLNGALILCSFGVYASSVSQLLFFELSEISKLKKYNKQNSTMKKYNEITPNGLQFTVLSTKAKKIGSNMFAINVDRITG